MMKSKVKIFGDFQTPSALANQILNLLQVEHSQWTRVLEPTCGRGNFIYELLQLPHPPREIIGIELQSAYIRELQSYVHQAANQGVRFQPIEGDIFSIDLRKDIEWNREEPLLIIGNPPWVTNSMLGVLESDNLPQKSNFKNQKGLDAVTGSSNFDIAEYIWIKLLTELKDQATQIALLCKTSVARNVLRFAYQNNLPVYDAEIYKIDSKKWFNAAVDACLFSLSLNRNREKSDYRARIFSALSRESSYTTIGFINDSLISDMDTFQELVAINGVSPIEWRQGIKHDAASVMELRLTSAGWTNGLKQQVDVEEDYIYPLVKSSDLQVGRTLLSDRAVLVPQQSVGQDTASLSHRAPRLWAYLDAHRDQFAARKSSIYRGKPSFSIFGVGEYSFAEYKILVSGLYKQPYFVPLDMLNGKPVMGDDTCYLLPMATAPQALFVSAALNHPISLRFIHSIAFQDSKRPITKAVLSHINFMQIMLMIPFEELRAEAFRLMELHMTEFYHLPYALDVVFPPAQLQQMQLSLW